MRQELAPFLLRLATPGSCLPSNKTTIQIVSRCRWRLDVEFWRGGLGNTNTFYFLFLSFFCIALYCVFVYFFASRCLIPPPDAVEARSPPVVSRTAATPPQFPINLFGHRQPQPTATPGPPPPPTATAWGRPGPDDGGPSVPEDSGPVRAVPTWIGAAGARAAWELFYAERCAWCPQFSPLCKLPENGARDGVAFVCDPIRHWLHLQLFGQGLPYHQEHCRCFIN